ncbi:hypothetical protein JW964_16400 [candidate division KSB1 bacterium]|nr:hypothetical protein [candidate division KSB1 bacterium]
MQKISLILLIIILIFTSCSQKESAPPPELGLVDTGEPFNPIKWYNKERRDIAKVLPTISNINKEISGGPFILDNQMGLKSINFTFENSEMDGRLLSLFVEFEKPVIPAEAAKKFGVNIENIMPQKMKKYWTFPIQKQLIHSFHINLKPADTEASGLSSAWIVYNLKE